MIVQGVTLPTLYWLADKVDAQTPGQLRPKHQRLVDYNTCHICRSACRNPPLVLSCTPCLEVVLDKVAWGIFWKVFRRTCGPPTRSFGPTDRSAGVLVGRTHLSRTVVSLVGGDPRVPMSHKFTWGTWNTTRMVMNTRV
jgi:hypothetical protein